MIEKNSNDRLLKLIYILIPIFIITIEILNLIRQLINNENEE